jgi:hypothetical protein
MCVGVTELDFLVLLFTGSKHIGQRLFLFGKSYDVGLAKA